MRRSALVVLALALAACSAAPTPTQTAATPTAAASATSHSDPTNSVAPASTESAAPNTASATASASPLAPTVGLTEIPLDVPAYLLESVPARGQVDAVSHHVGEFTYTSGDQVYLGNIVRGTRSLFTADAGYQLMGVDSTWSDSSPVYGWAEGKYDNATGRTPCSATGAVTWRLFVSNGFQSHLVTSGVNLPSP